MKPRPRPVPYLVLGVMAVGSLAGWSCRAPQPPTWTPATIAPPVVVEEPTETSVFVCSPCPTDPGCLDYDPAAPCLVALEP